MTIVIPLKATDADLIRIGSENPGYQVEREEDGTVTMSTTHSKTSPKCVEAAGQLWLYAKRVGGKAFSSDGGFAIGPGERIKCPDAAWASSETIALVPPEDEEDFWPISPDVAIEIKSHSDAFRDTVAKAKTYCERGSKYAVAIDPETRDVRSFGTPPDGLVLDSMRSSMREEVIKRNLGAALRAGVRSDSTYAFFVALVASSLAEQLPVRNESVRTMVVFVVVVAAYGGWLYALSPSDPEPVNERHWSIGAQMLRDVSRSSLLEKAAAVLVALAAAWAALHFPITDPALRNAFTIVVGAGSFGGCLYAITPTDTGRGR